MNPAIEDELLSAYFDGELSDAQKAAVEGRLAADPAARQVLDELRVVSASLQSLPRYALGEDLTERVLRLAEQRILTEGLTSRTAQPREQEPRGRRLLRTRALVWGGMALALGLVLMVFYLSRAINPGGNEVVKEPLAPRPGGIDVAQKAETTTKEKPQMVPVNPPRPGGAATQKLEVTQQPVLAKPVLLVKCYLSGEGAPKRAFDLLIKRHEVTRIEDDPRTGQALKRDPKLVPSKWAAEGKLKSFYAEVQPAVIQALLQELAAKPELYPAVLVVVAPGAKDQEPWQAFSRDFDQSVSSSTPPLPASLAGSNDVVRVVFAVQALKPADASKSTEQK